MLPLPRIEPEMAFANLEDDMDCAEAYIRQLADLATAVDETRLEVRIVFCAVDSCSRTVWIQEFEQKQGPAGFGFCFPLHPLPRGLGCIMLCTSSFESISGTVCPTCWRSASLTWTSSLLE